MAKFIAEARKWARENKLHGPQAFLRYVIFTYVELLNTVSQDFIFKGGNLLWVYIKTPRATIDLDLSTLKEKSHNVVRSKLEEACSKAREGIDYSVVKFEEVEQRGNLGSAVVPPQIASYAAIGV